jgi:hypothetical protein
MMTPWAVRPGTTFHAAALSSLGVDPQGSLRAMI